MSGTTTPVVGSVSTSSTRANLGLLMGLVSSIPKATPTVGPEMGAWHSGRGATLALRPLGVHMGKKLKHIRSLQHEGNAGPKPASLSLKMALGEVT